MVKGHDILTHSRIEAFKRCPRNHYYRYELGLRPTVEAKALRMGRIFHHLVDTLRKEDFHATLLELYKEYSHIDQLNEQWTLWAMIKSYAGRWENCNLIAKYVESELSFNVPLYNPTSDRKSTSRTFTLAGKMDAIVILRDGRLALFETKTTSDTLDDRYWRMLLMDPQISGYFLRAKDLGHDVDTVIYDVMKKPGIKPYKATPVENRKYKKDGTLYANMREEDEIPEDWGARLYNDIMSRPDFYLARQEIPRLQQDLDIYSQEIWQIAQDIIRARNDGRWYRCAIRMTCEFCCYFDICSGLTCLEATPIPDGFQVVDNLHPELESDDATETTTKLKPEISGDEWIDTDTGTGTDTVPVATEDRS